MFGVVGAMSGGLIEISALNFIPLIANHWPTYLTLLVIGLILQVFHCLQILNFKIQFLQHLVVKKMMKKLHSQ